MTKLHRPRNLLSVDPLQEMKVIFTWIAALVVVLVIPVECDFLQECTRATDWFNRGECIDVKYGILERAIAQINQEVSNMKRILENLRSTEVENLAEPVQPEVKPNNREDPHGPRSARSITTPGEEAASPRAACVCTSADSGLPAAVVSKLEDKPVVVEESVLSYNNRDVLVVSLPEEIAVLNESAENLEPVQLHRKDNLQPFALSDLEIAPEPAKQNESSFETPKISQEPTILTVESVSEPGTSEPVTSERGIPAENFKQREVVRRLDEFETSTAAKFEDLEKQLQVLREELSTAIKVIMADAEEKKKMFFDGSKQGKVIAVRTLLIAGVKPQETDSTDKGRTALHKAAKEGHKEIVKMLIAANASANARDFNSWTPLHFAVSQGHADVAQVLLDAGASSLARVDDRATPLHLAAQRGSKEVMEVLLKTNASVHAKDINGNTPLHLATLNNHAEVAELLLKAGASRLIKNNLQETPREVALSRGFTNLAEIL